MELMDYGFVMNRYDPCMTNLQTGWTSNHVMACQKPQAVMQEQMGKHQGHAVSNKDIW